MGVDERRHSFGLTWAEQWDYSFNDQEKFEKDGSRLRKFADYNKKIKSAAILGFAKTKFAASVGAKKMKKGTSTGIRWVKDRCQKKAQKRITV